MARTRQQPSRTRGNASRGDQRGDRRQRTRDEGGIIPVLARTVREVESAVERRTVTESTRTKFQVVSLLVREARAAVRADDTSTESFRDQQMKRLDGVATILAKTAARESSLLELLAEDAVVSPSAQRLKREMQQAAGLEVEPEAEPTLAPSTEANGAAPTERRVVPQSVAARQLANPFLAPDFSAAQKPKRTRGELARWELLGPLFRAFEEGDGGMACMPLPARVTAPSSSPTSRAWGRPHRRCSQPRRRTPTRCWPSCPTW